MKKKKRTFIYLYITLMMFIIHGYASAQVFNSGSTGADGAFSPTVNTILDLPPSGMFNYTTVNIPTGVTVTFRKNTTNTPVVILAQGNVTIAGTVSVNGSTAPSSGAEGDGNTGDDGQPGTGGPGGYEGGFGGLGGGFGGSLGARGGDGKGPGGGNSGTIISGIIAGGSGGGFGSNGNSSTFQSGFTLITLTSGGTTYGTTRLLPLVGGSGGGGGAGSTNFTGAGGGGGGGAILIASSGTISVNGGIIANGGSGGSSSGVGCGAPGGGGSGGAIRLIANTISGNGTISAVGNIGGIGSGCGSGSAGSGGNGIIRLESYTFQRTAATTPVFTTGTPGSVFVPGLPSLAITTVAGVAVPANPTGSADVTLPATTTQPVTVGISATNIPVGTTVTITVTPTIGARTSALSSALTGTDASSTATASITLPTGPSVILASATFTVTQLAALGIPIPFDLAGEEIELVRVASAIGGRSTMTFITKAGKEIPVDGLYGSYPDGS